MRASPTIGMLGEEYLKDSIERGKQPRTMEQRESRLKAHIPLTIGDVAGRSRELSTAARCWRRGRRRSSPLAVARTCVPARCEAQARWRSGWLDRSIDPLDGFEIGRANVLHGATGQYVDPRLRPETRQVKAMAPAADELADPRAPIR